MEIFEAIKTRRSVKHFQSDFKIPENQLRQIMEAATLAPSSFNLQHWRFLVITDPELKDEIKDIAWGQAQVSDCSALIILTGDKEAPINDAAKLWQKAPQEAQDFLLPAIEKFYGGEDKADLREDEVHRSNSMAAQNIMLSARALGYDTCPMIGYDYDKLASKINLPNSYVISFIIALGKATSPGRPRAGQHKYEEVVFHNRFAL